MGGMIYCRQIYHREVSVSNAYAKPVRRVSLALLLVLTILGAACSPGGGRSHAPATERTQVLADWEALRFGMFIHFGMSTFTGYEFGEFSAQAKEYTPNALDVDQWIRVARDGGMKYAVLTTKHCYGHALWDSRYTDYDVEAGPVKTDVVRAFVDACRKYGLNPGRAIDDDSNTRWAAEEGAGECWLEFDLGTEREFDGAYLSEGWERVRSFALEARADEREPWRPFYQGTTIGTAGLTVAFPSTKRRYVRLHILEASAAPTIWDFELYGKMGN
jgi:hypothetical protein